MDKVAANADEFERLVSSAGRMGVALSAAQARQMLRLLDELGKWNQAYNLTALNSRDEWLTHHLLDSLSIAALLRGSRIADVGTGAGFPGLPLAILRPDCTFSLIDSNGKKIRFVQHAVRALGLTNVIPQQARAESLAPGAPFDTVVARALAALPELAQSIRGLCGPQTRVLAMKGRRPDQELAALDPRSWQVEAVQRIEVPGLDAERQVVTMRALKR
jgi:16S rRNA (guanine527-N7)-methyltransferase